jgi:hypothetical protein
VGQQAKVETKAKAEKDEKMIWQGSFQKAAEEAQEKAREDAEKLSVDNLKKLLSGEHVFRSKHVHDDCVKQTELAARLVEHLTKTGKQLAKDEHNSLQLLLTCIVIGCLDAVDETVCGSPYCAKHEHHPVGKASFEVVRQVLIDIRESTGYAEWKWNKGYPGWKGRKASWYKLETYTTMEELEPKYNNDYTRHIGGIYGVEVKGGKLVRMDLNDCNLTGTLPPSLAALDTLQELDLSSNNLGGFLPAHMGSASCLPSLKELNVCDNEQLGGMIDVHFLASSETCVTNGCHRSMQFPFLSGASLSSFNIQGIFRLAPKAVVSEERAQGKVAFLYPKGSPKNTGTEDEQDQMDRQFRQYTDHLKELWREQDADCSYEEWLAKHISKWCCWAETWLSELRQLREGCLFVFVTPENDAEEGEWDAEKDGYKLVELLNKQSFETKFKSKMYTEGKVDDRDWSSTKGSFISGRAWCKDQCFDPTRGFADEGWGFEESEQASGIMDWERRHLASVSKKHGLQTVFISNAIDPRGDDIMVQVARPSWYPYDGLEALLGTFVHEDKSDSKAFRMVPAEEADEEWIAKDKKRRWGEEKGEIEVVTAHMLEEEVDELREECVGLLQWILENKLEGLPLDEEQQLVRGKAADYIASPAVASNHDIIEAALAAHDDEHHEAMIQARMIATMLRTPPRHEELSRVHEGLEKERILPEEKVDEALALLEEEEELNWAATVAAKEEKMAKLKQELAEEQESLAKAAEGGSAPELLVMYRRMLPLWDEWMEATKKEKKHPCTLEKFDTEDDGFGCDSCGASTPEGATMHGCRACDFDLCQSCFADWPPKIMCPQEHLMQWSNYAEDGYAGGWCCSDCEEDRTGFRLFCFQCEEDYCKACAMSRTKDPQGSPQPEEPAEVQRRSD